MTSPDIGGMRMPKRSILPVEDLSDDGQKFLDILNEEADLAVVIIGTSYLDACLGALLHRFFVEGSTADRLLDVQGGALGSFQARADACYVLGIINKPLYQDLVTISKIRNQFAHHHLALNFDLPAVAELCTDFRYVGSLRQGNMNKPLDLTNWMTSARNQFILTAVMISQRLLLTGLSLRRQSPAV